LDQLRPSTTPFHGVAPGRRVQPLGQIDLPVWFGAPSNFHKEMLTFEVVGFRGAYHAILGRPCYAKFMAVPNYTYLKMKMPGPNGVITVGSSIEHAFDCDVECVEHAEALALDEALVTTLLLLFRVWVVLELGRLFGVLGLSDLDRSDRCATPP
jgi:hypothetical protein